VRRWTQSQGFPLPPPSSAFVLGTCSVDYGLRHFWSIVDWKPLRSHAKSLVDLYRAFRNAYQETTETTLQLEGFCIKIRHHLEFLQKAWNSLPEGYQTHQVKTLSILEIKLQNAEKEVGSLVDQPVDSNFMMKFFKGNGVMKRLRYITWAKSSLQQTMGELDKWSKEFDMSWYMMARMASPILDNLINQDSASTDSTSAILSLKHLRTAIQKSKQSADDRSSRGVLLEAKFPFQQGIAFCSAFLTFDASINDSLLLDTIAPKPNSDYSTTRRDIKNITSLNLGLVKQQIMLAACHGI
jgi:hypothetical protein